MLGRAFVDTDREVEERVGCTIAELFEREGEAHFRALESEALARAVERSRSEGLVIATGGGIVLHPANRDVLVRRTLTIYLSASSAFLLPRLERGTRRPLLRGHDLPARIERLHAERDPLYLQVAAVVVPAEGATVARTAARIAQLLARRSHRPHGE